MLRGQKIFIVLICLSILASVISSYAEEEIEDLVDIYESNHQIIAILEGSKTITSDLRSKEKVLWKDSKGYLGAFLTNEQFLVISTSSRAWQALPLRLNESQKGVALLSPTLALLVTGERTVGFDAASNRFIETQLPIHHELVAAKVEKYVAVVVTSSQAFGLSVNSSGFNEVRFRIRETVEEIKLTSSKASIRTSDRLLTFQSPGSSWNEHRLN